MKRGLILHLLSRVAFALSAVILHVYLGRILTVKSYGLVGIILNLININYLFVSNGVRQSVSMFISRQIYSWADLVRKSAVLQLGIGGLLFAANYYGSWIVASLLGDHSLEVYIRQTAFIIPVTALHFLCIGMLNGEQRFGAESGLTALYSVLRLIAIPFLLLLPTLDKVTLVIDGLLFAVLSSATLGTVLVLCRPRTRQIAPQISFGEIARKSFALIFFYAGITLLMNVDTILLKRLTNDDQTVGYYTAASSFSKIIYFISIALISVIIPSISRAYHSGDKVAARSTFIRGLDFFVILMAPLFIVLAASGRHLFSILYSKSYAVSGDVFLILVPAIFLLSLAVYLNAVVHAISTVKKHSMAFFLLALNIALNLLLIPKFGSIGTGVSLLIPSMLGCFMYAMPAQSALAAKLDLKQLSKRICLLVIMAVISNLVYRYLAFSNIYSLCVSYALLLSFCIVMMKILGLFVGKDILGYLRSSPNKSSL